MPLPDYYAILEVPSTATLAQIKQAYRRLARLHHPDLNRQIQDTFIKQLNEAYNVLSDAEKRAAYNAQHLEELRHQVIMEALRRRQEEAQREQKMTWTDGLIGFVRELKKEMQSTD